MEGLIVLGLLGGVLLMPFIWAIATLNRFVGLRQHLRESWADIEVEMKRRYELIPNLVETVKGYATHEQTVLERVVELRNQAQANHGTAAEQAVDETALQLGVKQLFAVVENYPDLRADLHFMALQKELSNTEDRIAASRRFYNGNIRDLNQLREQFPTNIIASLGGFERGDYFEIANSAQRVVPRIDL